MTKNMNKFLSLFIFGSLTLANVGCNEECEDWYEGDDCEIEMRQKFVGSYLGTWTQDGQPIDTANFSWDTLKIAAYIDGGPELQVNQLFFHYYAIELTGSTTFEFPYQHWITYSIENGTGQLNGDQLTVSYLMFGGGPIQMAFTGTKL